MTSFWRSPRWLAYEAACGDAPYSRAEMLATAPWQTRVVDLSKPEHELWRGIRRSYHAPINRLASDRQFATVNVQDMRRPQALHLAEAGRLTRPQATWDLQAQWLKDWTAACVVGCVLRDDDEGQPTGIEDVAFAYVSIDGDWAYYFSAASTMPFAMHAIQWQLMRALRQRGVRWYELGWQGQATDDKGRGIEFFRRGFGGDDMPAGWRERP